MSYAYTPAFDFDPKETDMTFEELMTILKDTTLTDYQRAANIHAALTAATRPSALTLQPQKARKARTATPRPKSPASDSLNGFAGHVDNTVSDAN
jgi:hypothetical protein